MSFTVVRIVLSFVAINLVAFNVYMAGRIQSNQENQKLVEEYRAHFTELKAKFDQLSGKFKDLQSPQMCAGPVEVRPVSLDGGTEDAH